MIPSSLDKRLTSHWLAPESPVSLCFLHRRPCSAFTFIYMGSFWDSTLPITGSRHAITRIASKHCTHVVAHFQHNMTALLLLSNQASLLLTVLLALYSSRSTPCRNGAPRDNLLFTIICGVTWSPTQHPHFVGCVFIQQVVIWQFISDAVYANKNVGMILTPTLLTWAVPHCLYMVAFLPETGCKIGCFLCCDLMFSAGKKGGQNALQVALELQTILIDPETHWHAEAG